MRSAVGAVSRRAGVPAVHLPWEFPLAERTAYHRVPGLSLAVIEDGEVIWVGGFGLTRRVTGTPVDAGTLFQAASISKPVAALAALRLVEEGRLHLDEDINGALKSWVIAETPFTRREKVTLRRLLSHTAGFNVWGFPGYAAGAPLPDLTQILEGRAPANTPAVRVGLTPGSQWLYSGGGYMVLQQLLADASGESFAALTQRLVLDPFGMRRSRFKQPLSPSLAHKAAAGHDNHGRPVAGNWHVYPELAAAGLWATAADLARLALAVQAASAGRRTNAVDRDTARLMLTPAPLPTPFGSRWGLGFEIHGEGDSACFGHGGGNEGYVAQLIAYAHTGQGAAVMTNGANGGALIAEILGSLATARRWPR